MEQKPRKTDRRTLYTKGVIKEAFLAALKTKAYDKITVSDLCKAAEINRSTFYLHYADALAVFDEILEELLDKITAGVQTVLSANPTMDIADCFRYATTAQAGLLGDKRTAFVLSKGFMYPHFVDRFSEQMARQMLPHLRGGQTLCETDRLLLLKSMMFASVALSSNYLETHKQKELPAYTVLLAEYLFTPCLEKLM